MSRRPISKPVAANATVPPRPLDKRWYIHADQQTYGPFTGDEIRQMAGKGQVVESDLVYPESGKEWVQAKDDPTIRSLFNKEFGAPTSRHLKTFSLYRVTLAIGALLLLSIAWIGWPYYAFYKLGIAFRAGDVPALESAVVWNSVRQGLRSDLNAVFLQILSTDTSNKNNESGSTLGTGLAAVLAPTIINQLVEGYVTPQAIAAISHGEDSVPKRNIADSPANFAQTIQSVGSANWN